MANKNLVMSFMNEEGKKASVTLNEVRDDVTDAEVSAAMDTIVAKNIFQSTGGDLKVKDSAQLVERTVGKLTVK